MKMLLLLWLKLKQVKTLRLEKIKNHCQLTSPNSEQQQSIIAILFEVMYDINVLSLFLIIT